MEIKDFDYFINREKNKPCLVAGNAPSLKNFPYDKFKGIYFLMNSGPILLKGRAYPTYWLSANYKDPVPHLHYKKINLFRKCTYIFSDTATYCAENKYNHNLISNRLRIDWFAFDERHINHKKCDPVLPCCELVDIYPQRITIFEYIQKHFGMSEVCPKPTTAVIYSLMFAIIAGCSPIYLQGIELPVYQKDYLQYKMLHPESLRNIKYVLRSYFRGWIHGRPEHSGFYDGYERNFSVFEYLINLCRKIGIEIYNLSQTSALNQIKILPYLNYRKVC